MVCQIQSEDGIGDAYVVRVRSFFFFFSSRRRHTRCLSDWNSDVCSSDLVDFTAQLERDVLPPHVVVEVANHVPARWPTAGDQRNPLSGKMRQEPGGVEAEVVIARAPRNGDRKSVV